MNDQTDAQLLQTYAKHRSEPAFMELVRRHVDLVHSAALRMVCDSHLAQDVTQSVFVALAQNAVTLSNHPVLSGWLHRTTQNIAAQTVRTDVRRRHREQEAVAMNETLSAEAQVSWDHISPHLDAALGELSEPDRDVVILRYFEKKSAREMAGLLGIGEDAAQKRVSRAVERLREFLTKRGITVGASGLVFAVSANAVQAAPVGLALTISTAAALTGTTLATSATITTTKAIAMTALQKTVVASTIVVLAGFGIYEAGQALSLREQVQTLRLRQASFVEQIEQLQTERNDSSNQLIGLRADIERLSKNSAELLRLRGEVNRLRTSQSNNSNDPMDSAAKAWLAGVDRLKQYLEQNPNQGIPELVLALEADWLRAAKLLDSEDGLRRALGSIRDAATVHAAEHFADALKQYMQANDGRFPAQLSELTPYLPPSMGNSILSRWAVQSAKNFTVTDHRDGDWLIVEMEPVDEMFDMRSLVSPSRRISVAFNELARLNRDKLQKALESVTKTYAEANGGRKPDRITDAFRYARTAEERTAILLTAKYGLQSTNSNTNQNSQADSNTP